MIETTTLAEARVLIVGSGDLIDEVATRFSVNGVKQITVIRTEGGPSTSAAGELYEQSSQDPEELIKSDPKYFASFSIVLAVNTPRSFEVALSDIRWPKDGGETDPDLPMLVMRNDVNNCKFRCQYRELPLQGGKSSKFVSLPMELLPWTDEKRNIVASTIQDELKPEKDQKLQAYLAAALAVIQYKQSKGSWPTVEDKHEVGAIAKEREAGRLPEAQDFIALFLEKGLAAAHETTIVMGRLISADAMKLLTGSGQPVNNSNLDDIIQIVATQ